MVRIPDATSLSQVSTRSQMPVATYRSDQMAEATQNLGRTMQAVGEQAFNEQMVERERDRREQERHGMEQLQANRQMEEARARSYVLQKSIETINGFDNDPDYATYEERYGKAMQSATDDALKLISNPQQAALFREQTNGDILRGRDNLRTRSQGMAADVGLTNMQQNIIANNSSALATQDPVLKARLLQENATLIDAMHNQFPQQFKASDAFKAKQQASVEGYALPQFSTRNADDQLNLIAQKLGYTVGDDEKSSAGVSKNFPIKIRQDIQEHAQRTGVSPDLMARVLHIENAPLNPNAVSPTGAMGLAQFTGETARRYNVDRKDPTDSIRGMADKLKNDADYLRKELGREPLAGEVYLAYQQGEGGAKALLSNPEAKAVDALSSLKSVSRQDAERAIQANGGHLNMTAAEFAQKWIDKVESTATPGVQGLPTGTELDVVPYEMAQKLYEPAAQNAFFSRMDSDPQAAMQMLNTPAFARIPEAKKKEWRAAARTAFGNLEENAKIDRFMQTATNNSEAWTAFVDGTLQPSQLAQLEANGKVTPEFANYIRTEQSKSVPRRNAVEMNDKYTDIFERYNELGIKSVKGVNVGSTSKGIEDYVLFQREVVQAAAQGYLTRDQANTFLKNTTGPLSNRIDRAQTTPNLIFANDPNFQGYQVIDSWMKTNGMADNKQVKAELMKRYVLAKDAADDGVEPVEPGKIAKQVTEGYMRSQYPILQMMSETPNGIMPRGTNSMTTIMPGPSAAKPEAKVQAAGKLQRDNNGNFAIVYPDRTFRELTPQEAEKYKQQGY